MQPRPTPLQPVLDNVLGGAIELLGARSGSLMLLDDRSGDLRIKVARGLPQEIVPQVRVRPGEGIAGWVLAHSRPRVLRRDERAADSLSNRDRLSAAISAPLRVRQRTIGVINISDSMNGDFGRADVRVLVAFAGQAAAAIENARLYETLRQEVVKLHALHRIGQAITSSLNLSRVLREVLGRARDILGAQCGSIMLLDAARQELRIEEAVGLDEEVQRAIRVPLGQGIAGAVAQSGEPVILNEGTVDARSAGGRGREHADAALCVPVRLHGRTIGVINLSRRAAGGDFGRPDLAFLMTLADQAAVAIENARLYRLLKRRVVLADQKLRRTNRRLKQETRKTQAIVQSMADGVVALSDQGRVRMLNPAAEAMLGIPAAQARGRALRRWPAGDILQGILDEARQSGGMSVAKEVPVPGEEYRVLSANVSPLRDDRGRGDGFLTVLTDITELKEISDMKTELVSFASHELRNPLTSIRGFAEMLHSAGAAGLPDEMQHESCEIILSECDRLLAMINEMLDVSRMEAGRGLDLALGPVDVPALLQRAVAAQRAYASRHELALGVADDLPAVSADGDKIYQVVVNLLSNAVKYSPMGGTVTTAASRHGDRVRISVADQGLGIPPEMIGKLFQRYYRVETKAHSSIRGTGLGLFFVKGVVEAHGGSVWVESQYGKGSRFVFELPAAP